jgi:hypothetical protein
VPEAEVEQVLARTVAGVRERLPWIWAGLPDRPDRRSIGQLQAAVSQAFLAERSTPSG